MHRREVHLLGVRHHGPGSARSVVRTLDAVQPVAVLVEMPADLEPALRWIGDPELVPPVALLGYVVAEPARAVFAPFAEFSPEWQAVAWANEHDVPVRAIDLPLAVTIAGPVRATTNSSASRRRPIRSAISPRRPATPTRNAGGRT